MRGSWCEFLRDSHSTHPLTAEPDKARTVQRAREALDARSAQYLMHNPDKAGWTAEDHHVRFVVAVVADNMLAGLWSEKEWRKNGGAVAGAVFEVLVFLKATATGAGGGDAGVDGGGGGGAEGGEAAVDPPRYEA